MDTTAERIKHARQSFGLSQAQFGALAGVTKSAVSQWERFQSEPQRDALLALQRKKQLSPDWVAYGRGAMLLSPGAEDVDPEIFCIAKALRDLPEWQLVLAKELIEKLRLIKLTPALECPPNEVVRPHHTKGRAPIDIAVPTILQNRSPRKKV